MEPERWQQIERLFYSALHEDSSARAAFLQRTCGGDEALRKAVELLLAQHEKDGNFLEPPAIEVVAKVLARDQQAGAASGNPPARATPDTAESTLPLAFAGDTANLNSGEKISFGPVRFRRRIRGGAQASRIAALPGGANVDQLDSF